MKFLSLILSLTISIQTFATSEQECIQKEGYTWNPDLGCIVTTQVADIREDANECKDLEGDELKACLEKVASDSQAGIEAKHKNSIKKNEGLVYTAAGVTVLGTAYLLFKNKKELSSCGEASAWLIFGGAVSALVGEAWARIRYNKLIKDAQKDYESQSSVDESENQNDTTTYKQIAAFDQLIKIERAREKAETTRRDLYTASIVSFSAAGLVAVFEALKVSPSTCNVSSTPKDAGTAPKTTSLNQSTDNIVKAIFPEHYYLKGITLAEYTELLIRKFTPIKSAYAQSSGTPLFKGLFGGIKKAANSAGKFANQAFSTPVGRGVLAGALGGAAALLKKQAKKNIDISKERQQKLKEMRDIFAATGGVSPSRCTEEMRNDQNNPVCFCHNEDGSPNLKRKKLKICNDVWGSATVPVANNYNGGDGNAADMTRTCINRSFEADITCACRTDNSCLKTKPAGLKFGADYAWTNPILSQANALFSNGLESAGLQAGSLNNQAATIKKKAEELKKKPKYKKVFNKIATLEAKHRKASLGQARNFIAKNGSNPFAPAVAAIPVPKNPKEALKQLASIKRNSPVLSRRGKKQGSFDDLDFGEGAKAGIEIQDDLAQVMDKDFKIKGDINNNPDNNIFKILSNRYHSTGIKKLFEEKEKR